MSRTRSTALFITIIILYLNCIKISSASPRPRPRERDYDEVGSDSDTESGTKIEHHFYKIHNITSKEEIHENSILIHPVDVKNPLKKSKPKKKKTKIILNQCTEGVFENIEISHLNPDTVTKFWTVPEWLKGPKSEHRSEKLNNHNFFNGALFKFVLATKQVGCGLLNKTNFQTYKVRRSDVYRNNSYDIDWQYGGYSDYFTPFGEFKMNEYFLDPDSFCVSNYHENWDVEGGDISITLEVCIPPTKIRKCCPYGTVVKFGLNSVHEMPTCIEILGEDWAPFYFQNGVGVDSVVEDVSYFSELFNPECSVYDKLTPNRQAAGPYLSDIKVLSDGTVLTRSSGNHRWDKPKVYGDTYITDFCIDGFLDSDQMDARTDYEREGPVDFIRIPENQILLFCHQPRQEETEDVVYSWLYFLLFSFSSTILGFIVIVYCLLWRKQNIHGWTTLGFTASMFFWFLFSAVTHGSGLFQGSGWGIQVGGTACVLNGILWHFFYIATFAWMSVLNYDLWSSTCKPSIPSTAQRSNIHKKLTMYCCAGFGPSFIVVMIALIIENQVDIFDDFVIRPMYGHDICCLDKTALLYYAFSVSSVFFVLNLFFAGSTIVFLCKYRKKTKQCSAIQREMSHFGKLFILMGFTWIFEMASWNENLTWYWAVFDVYNIIQAGGLFWIFVGRREVLEQLFDEYKFLGVWCSCLKSDAEKKLSETEKASQGYSQTYKGISMATIGNALSTCVEPENPQPFPVPGGSQLPTTPAGENNSISEGGEVSVGNLDFENHI